MRLLSVILVAAIAGFGAAHAQNPPLLIPAPPAPPPPPLFVPPPVPSVVTPIPTPSYGARPVAWEVTPASSRDTLVDLLVFGIAPAPRAFEAVGLAADMGCSGGGVESIWLTAGEEVGSFPRLLGKAKEMSPLGCAEVLL